MYYVYLIIYGKNKEQRYIGYTSDLKRRIREHQIKKREVKLIYYEAYPIKDMAIRRERSLKRSGSARRALYERLRLL